MLKSIVSGTLFAVFCVVSGLGQNSKEWRIDTTKEWQQTEKESKGLTYEAGFATPNSDSARYLSVTRIFETSRSAKSISIKQSPVWQNWTPIKNIGPSNLQDAPVALNVGPEDYWLFGRYGSERELKDFRAENAHLEGFDVPLKTTPFPAQFDAPGGLMKGLGGYHAWQSKDMINWVHHGPVTEGFARWVTSAEYVDGKAYIYYDFPNDQDPHLYIDDDLTDGKPGMNMGLAFKDPSHGSDCGIIRDLQGRFHLIYEDWSPINAREHSWDSPLAGHAVSSNGIGNFAILPSAVDRRTKPTGKVDEYLHPHWTKEDPKNFPSNVGKYEVHEPKQDAFGDWAAICIGGQYYLFCDFHPANDKIRVGWFSASSLNEPFTFCGEIGSGHPDPDIIFAEGQFYLVTQMETDYVSPGPWVEKVEVRVGVDKDGDNVIDEWTEWREIKETYDYIEGFAKQVKCTPASISLSNLSAGMAFSFELRTQNTAANKARPIFDNICILFDQ